MPSFDLCQLEFDPRADFAIVHLQQQPAQIKRAFLLPMKEQTVTFDNIFTEKHRLKNRLSTQARLFLNMFAGLDCQQVSPFLTNLVAFAKLMKEKTENDAQ
jgi:hypothetical protein